MRIPIDSTSTENDVYTPYIPVTHPLGQDSTEDTTENEDTSSQDEFLAMLGIGGPAWTSSASSVKHKEIIQEEALTSQNGSASNTVSDINDMKGKPSNQHCAICGLHKAAFICLPCRHWGPCLKCVPEAEDKTRLYPKCLKCEDKYTNLVRVYKH